MPWVRLRSGNTTPLFLLLLHQSAKNSCTCLVNRGQVWGISSCPANWFASGIASWCMGVARCLKRNWWLIDNWAHLGCLDMRWTACGLLHGPNNDERTETSKFFPCICRVFLYLFPFPFSAFPICLSLGGLMSCKATGGTIVFIRRRNI